MDRINFKDKTVLVTGGKGYLGAELVKALKLRGALVSVVDNQACYGQNEYDVDITEPKALTAAVAKIQPQIVFHLAATLNRNRGVEHYDSSVAVNIIGTKNLLEALKNTDYEKLIFTSTSEIYGDNQAPYAEEMLPRPVSPYSFSKASAEMLITTVSELYAKNFVILRLFNFYGPGMPEGFFIPAMIKALQTQAVFNMTEGRQTRDFMHVGDVVNALLLAANKPAANNEIFNVCSSQAKSLRDFVLECKKELKSPCKINFGALPYRENEIWNMLGDNSKIVSALGFTLTKTVASFIHQPVNELEYE